MYIIFLQKAIKYQRAALKDTPRLKMFRALVST